ncbi:hypothetical protein FPSE_05478 [Fusarium pseudograminearum CS3096]|uniref:Uncharacterized protein n=1 Tax=Fusarium pseudograminearum (strain CS3096) TaxID=1028729 RepID=K3VIJ4_FUSPC|nr:hypothetical protein FPSE_05478 [Fusarium pseudograminearum CS3096]EKJ74332.1 hypothetical protein FPSE_05478 [Fusarium pseudograminearum CS3096]
MKYSTATILVLAQGIFAAPSFLNKIGHKNFKASHRSTGGDITLSIKVSQSPMNGAFHKAVKDEICWLICASDEIECPDDWDTVLQETVSIDNVDTRTMLCVSLKFLPTCASLSQ